MNEHEITLVLTGAALGFVLYYVVYLIYHTTRLTIQEPDYEEPTRGYGPGGLDD